MRGEENMDVYFDDYSVELVAGPVVQLDDSYPYGMSFHHLNNNFNTPPKKG